MNEESKGFLEFQIDKINISEKANKIEKLHILEFMKESMNNCNIENIFDGINLQILRYQIFAQKMNGIFEKQIIERPLSNFMSSNVFNLKLHSSNAHTIKIVLIQIKRTYLVRQGYEDYYEEVIIPFSERNSIISTDFTKDFQFYKTVLFISQGTLSYSSVMKGRRVFLIFCGLYCIFNNKIEKPSDLIKYLFQYKIEGIEMHLKRISIITTKFQEFEHNLKSIIESFVNLFENVLENFITSHDKKILNEIIEKGEKYHFDFLSCSKNKELSGIPKWALKEINAYKLLEGAKLGINQYECEDIIKILKKKLVVKNIISDLETNKSSEKCFFKLLNSKFNEYDDNLVDILTRSLRKNIFKVEKNEY